jgi:hypothetical protein
MFLDDGQSIWSGPLGGNHAITQGRLLDSPALRAAIHEGEIQRQLEPDRAEYFVAPPRPDHLGITT